MKRTIAFIAMFLFIAGFILSCQKAEGAGGVKKQNTEAEVQMGIKQGGTGVVSEKKAAEQKSGKKEKRWKSWKYEGLLTEQEQEEFKALKRRWFGPGFEALVKNFVSGRRIFC